MSKSSTATNKLLIEILIEDGRLKGVALNNNLRVTKVLTGCDAHGKLAVNDRIVKLNDSKLKNTVDFYTLLRAIHTTAALTVLREEKKIREFETKLPIPKEKEQYFKRRQGYTYHMIKIKWRPGTKKLGLTLKCYQNSILVCELEPGSLAVQYFAIGDRIIDVDGELVGNAKVARHLLVDALCNRGCATCIIERPEAESIKQRIKQLVA